MRLHRDRRRTKILEGNPAGPKGCLPTPPSRVSLVLGMNIASIVAPKNRPAALAVLNWRLTGQGTRRQGHSHHPIHGWFHGYRHLNVVGAT